MRSMFPPMLAALAKKLSLAGLSPLQAGIVAAVFVFTLFGAIGTAYLFRWWNERRRIRTELAKIRHG